MGLKAYLKEVWNYFDLSAYCFPLIVAILDIISYIVPSILGTYNTTSRILASIGIFFVWIKLLTFSRGFENLAFLLRMIK